MDFDILRRRIESGFAASGYPGDHKLVCDEKGFEWEENQDMMSLKEAVKGKHWTQISEVVYDPFFHSLTGYFCMEAFFYYLPAYMLSAIDKERNNEYALHSVVARLTLNHKIEEPQFWQFIDQLNTQQRIIVREWLEFTLQNYKGSPLFLDYVRECLSSFWSNPSYERYFENF